MSTSELKLAFHGAARTVTGSRHLLTAAGRRVLIDAGLFQGLKALRQRNWKEPGFDPASIDSVLLTHTHIDHIGYLPRLVKLGLAAPAYLTPPAFDLAELMLLDSAKIQEEDARHANRKGYSKHRPALPLYTTDDAEGALELRRRQPFESWLELAEGGALRARFHQAGHLLGSAFIELRIGLPGQELRLVMSGDIGRYAVPLHLDPAPLPACDVLVIESTYGDRDHTRVEVADQLRRPFRETLEAGGTVLIPSFAVGRAQLVVLVLRRLMSSGQLPRVPIHIDSPMANDATRIYGRYVGRHQLDPDVVEDGGVELFGRGVRLHRTVEESKGLNDEVGPRIIVSSSGMLTGGRVLHHLRRLAPGRENLVALAGYQAPGTRGRSLVEGAERIKMLGGWVPVRCRVMAIEGLSGHADRAELLRWAAGAPRPPRLVSVVHGEAGPAEALATRLREALAAEVVVPELGQEIDLGGLAR